MPMPRHYRKAAAHVGNLPERPRRSPSPRRRRSPSPANKAGKPLGSEPSWATTKGWSTPERAKRLLIPDFDGHDHEDIQVRQQAAADLDIFPRWPDRPFRVYDNDGRHILPAAPFDST